MSELLGIVPGEGHCRTAEMTAGSEALLGIPKVDVALSSFSSWLVSSAIDADVNRSNKSWAVPDATEWQVLFIGINYTSTADAGDRLLQVQVERAGVVHCILGTAGVVQPASKVYTYTFASGLADLAAIRDTTKMFTPIPPTSILRAGDTLRIWDCKAIAAVADDMTVTIQYGARSV
jgi:hypothetical protein